MVKLVRSIIELETQMDESLHLEILLLLNNIKKNSPRCVGCKFKKNPSSREWLIEFVWYDAASMLAHFSSKSLQVLLKLLASRCSRLSFEEFSNTTALSCAASA